MSYTKRNFRSGGTLYASDLNAMDNQIAANETAAAGKYEKPGGGIPKTDLASAVQTSLGKADTAIQQHQDISGKYTKPVTGIPESDLAAAVQTKLNAERGLTAAQKTALLNMFSHIAFTDNTGPSLIATLSAALDAGDAPVTTMYVVTKNLSHASCSNAATSVAQGSSYTGVITAGAGWVLDTVTVSMGGVDITSTAWNSGTSTISIASVTGNIAITVTTEADSTPATYTEEVLATNLSPAGTRFNYENKAIDFAAGDYVEEQINISGVTTDNENAIAVANDTMGNGNAGTIGWFVFVRNKTQLVARYVNKDLNIQQDSTWVTPANPAAVTIQIKAEGVFVDGSLAGGIPGGQATAFNGIGTYMVGSERNRYSTATMAYIKIMRVSQ